MPTEEEIHYQNCSVRSEEDGASTIEVQSNDTSFEDDKPVYANQSTLNKCRASNSIEAQNGDQRPISMDSDSLCEDDDIGDPPKCCGERCCGLLRCFLATFGLTVAVVSFIFVGGFLFTVIEGPHESSSLHTLTKWRNDTIQNLAAELRRYHIYRNDAVWKEKLHEYFSLYEEKVVWACSHGYRGEKIEVPQKRWSLKGSLYFVVSILTTVGTGLEDMVPETTWGIVLFFIYTIIGIPLMMIWLITLGASFAHIVIAIYNDVCCYMFHRFCTNSKDSYQFHQSDKKYTEQNLFVPLLFVTLFLMCWLVIGMVALRSWEGIGYLQSIMYIFSILSTIGFYRHELKIFKDESTPKSNEAFAAFVSYILFGFILLSATVRVFYLLTMKCSGCRKAREQK